MFGNSFSFSINVSKYLSGGKSLTVTQNKIKYYVLFNTPGIYTFIFICLIYLIIFATSITLLPLSKNLKNTVCIDV